MESIRGLAHDFVAWARMASGFRREANFRRLEVAFVLLCNDEAERYVRRVQIDILKRHGINEGLSAPPHLTLKMGFRTADVGQFENYLENIASTTAPIHIDIKGFDVFDAGGYLFLDVAKNDMLNKLRKRIITDLATRFDVPPYDIEGDNFRFHITVAHGLPENRFQKERVRHSRTDPAFRFESDKLAILCHTGKQWVTYRKLHLQRPLVQMSK